MKKIITVEVYDDGFMINQSDFDLINDLLIEKFEDSFDTMFYQSNEGVHVSSERDIGGFIYVVSVEGYIVQFERN